MSDSDRISPTAHYTGYAWYRLGFPNAELFVTPTGRVLHLAYAAVLDLPATVRRERTVLLRTLENRHRVIEDALEGLAPDAVVELAGGLSPRGVTWTAERGVSYTEMDLPPMVALKRSLFGRRADGALRAAVTGRWRLVPMDVLSPAFAPSLREALVGAARPVVIAEGLLGYFAPALRRQVLGDVASALRGAGGGHVLVDVRDATQGRTASTRALRVGILVATRGRPIASGFAHPAEVERLFLDAGFDAVSALPPRDRGEPPVLSCVYRAEVRADAGAGSLSAGSG